jgi:ABC-2 type transport system ATP-binding protein
MENATQKLEIKSVQKATKTALVMDGVDITVHEGEIFALVGGPKSCKTLLSKIVVNLVSKTQGEVLVDGTSIKKPKVTAKKIGASLEQQKFYPHKTVFKTIEQHALIHGHLDIEHAHIVNTLNLVDLKKNMHQTLGKLDESDIARLKIALAIYSQPDIIILDDPFRKLTETQARTIRMVIKTIADYKKTAVFITAQKIEDIEDIADTIGIIDDGMMVMVKSYNQFIRDDAPYEKVRVHTLAPNFAAKTIEKDLGFETFLCGEWVVIETLPENAQKIADVLLSKDIKILSMQKVNRSLQEQYYEIIIARRNSFAGTEGATC